MRLDLGEDQRAIDEVFAAFFRRESPVAVVRRAEPLGFDPALWSKLAELRAAGMGGPENVGGGGAGLGDLAVVADHLGQTIAPVPFVEHAVATRLLARFDGVDGDDVVSGERLATLAVRPAAAGAEAWALVPAGAVAELVVGLVGDDLVCVAGDPPGAAPRNHAAMPTAARSAHSSSTTVLATGHDARAAFVHAYAEWQTLTAWSLTGIAAAAQEIALEYVKKRHQFDRPIGSFQAVQQQLADLPIAIAGAQLLAGKAAWAGDRGTPGIVDTDLCDITDFETLAGMAFLYASDAAAHATDRS